MDVVTPDAGTPGAGTPPTVVLTDDLFFRARIEAVAEAAGLGVTIARSAEEVGRALAGGAVRVVVDLAHPSADPATTIRELKSRPVPPVVVAFGPHRQTDLFRVARRAGADRVLARSAFVERLPEILGGDAV